MKKASFFLSVLLISGNLNLLSQLSPGPEVYLLTCAPGTATYSIYGHSALRIVIPEKNSDLVYNWGVFDFATPNFVWKFAKGRLEYMLGVYSFDRFLQEYFFEQRSVYQQKINLEPDEIQTLIALINENLKPENVKYRYDFFYDDCSTRIRDLLEKSLGEKLIYPPEIVKDIPTFREKVNQYQQPYPWLLFGVDLLLGSPADKKADLRDRMFLPIDLQEGLSDAVVNRNGKMIPLLQNPDFLIEFDPPFVKKSFITSPMFVLSLILILMILLSATIRAKTANKVIDLLVFSVFTLLAILLLFFNFFTDHQQTKWNLNMIWLSPFIILCLISLIFNKEWHGWFKLVFSLAIIAFLIQIFFPNAFNSAFIPLELMIVVRSSMRSGFGWNPLSVNLTEV
ncbi:MAG: hypothetical protein A2V64_11440 [Bacteroidetes bacterium RBG_13_43_22]|nr:MAG: hypothetical protein A2V64_11440 [Bacteroidetes bacterium RBG_13_43_22]